MKNTFKRVLTLVLSLALIASCMAGLTLVASAEESPEGYFNDFEDSVSDFAAKYGGTISQDDNGKDGKCLVYASNSANTWYAPYMTVAATQAAFPEVGVYTVSFDIKTTVVAPGTPVLKGRGSASFGLDNKQMANLGSLVGREADTWYHIDQTVTITQAMVDDTTFQFGLDSVNNNAENKIYLDNFSIVRVKKPAVYKFTSGYITSAVGASAVGPFAGLTDADFVNGVATVKLMAYNPTATTKKISVAYSWGHQMNTPRDKDGNAVTGTVMTQSVAAGEAKVITFKIPYMCNLWNSADGSDANSATDLPYTRYAFRMETGANGEKIYLYAYENAALNDSLIAFAGGATAATVADGLSEQYYEMYKNNRKIMWNGDAENGLAGWSTFSAAGGTVALSTDTPDGTGHSVKFTPNGQYASIGFDLAPAIVNKPELFLQGAGAGTYVIEFDAKLQEGYSGNATVTINSQNHQSANTEKGIVNTYIGGTGVTLTDQWQHFTATVNVSQAMLDTLDYWYAEGKSNSYDLILRLDAASGFQKSALPYYFIDNVTIGQPNAAQFDIQATTEGPYYGTKAGYLSSILGYASDYTGDVTVSYEFYNASAWPVKADLSIQATLKNSSGGDTWASYNKSADTKVIAPLTSETLTFTMPVVNGMVTTDSTGLQAAEVPMANFWVRFNFTPVTAMDGIVRAGVPAKMYVIPTAEKATDLIDQKQNLFKMSLGGKYFTGEEVIDAKVLGANVAVGDDLTVNFFANVPGTMTLNGEEIGWTYDEANKAYKYAYTGVNPQCMGDEITGTLTDTLGNTVDVGPYSVKTYCENKLAAADSSDALKTLVADMLEYGAAAQEYVGYNTDALVNDVEGVEANKTTDAVKPDSDQSSVKEPGYTARVKSMQLKLNNKLNIIANIETTEDWLVNVYEDGDILADNVDYIMDTANNQVIITNLPATKIGTVYTIEVYVGGELQNTVTYSMNSYISSKWAKGDNTAALVQALYNFGMSAIAFAA